MRRRQGGELEDEGGKNRYSLLVDKNFLHNLWAVGMGGIYTNNLFNGIKLLRISKGKQPPCDLLGQQQAASWKNTTIIYVIFILTAI